MIIFSRFSRFSRSKPIPSFREPLSQKHPFNHFESIFSHHTFTLHLHDHSRQTHLYPPREPFWQKQLFSLRRNHLLALGIPSFVLENHSSKPPVFHLQTVLSESNLRLLNLSRLYSQAPFSSGSLYSPDSSSLGGCSESRRTVGLIPSVISTTLVSRIPRGNLSSSTPFSSKEAPQQERQRHSTAGIYEYLYHYQVYPQRDISGSKHCTL